MGVPVPDVADFGDAVRDAGIIEGALSGVFVTGPGRGRCAGVENRDGRVHGDRVAVPPAEEQAPGFVERRRLGRFPQNLGYPSAQFDGDRIWSASLHREDPLSTPSR